MKRATRSRTSSRRPAPEPPAGLPEPLEGPQSALPRSLVAAERMAPLLPLRSLHDCHDTRGFTAFEQFGTASLLFHAAGLITLVALGRASMAPTAISASDHAARTHPETPRLEVLLEPARHGGGGGGAATAHGGRSHAPKRRADAVTLPVATPIAPTTPPREVPPSQAVALDAKPLASGLVFQVRSLDGAPTLGTSQGPGSRGGVGEGVGTGPVLTLRGE